MFKTIYDGYRVNEEGVVIGKRGYPMIPCDNGRGYPIVTVTINGKKTSKALHRIVAEAWIPNPEGLSDVNHKDSNRWNCHKDNLEWKTHGGNIAYSYEHGQRSAVGEGNARAVITEKEVREICEFIDQGLPSTVIRDKGYPYDRVRAIRFGKNWTHVSKDYNFRKGQ